VPRLGHRPPAPVLGSTHLPVTTSHTHTAPPHHTTPPTPAQLLYDTFSAFGVIVATPKIMRDPDTGNSKGFGFVSYDSFEASDAAIEAMHGQYLAGRQVSVSYAYKKDTRGGWCGGCGVALGLLECVWCVVVVRGVWLLGCAARLMPPRPPARMLLLRALALRHRAPGPLPPLPCRPCRREARHARRAAAGCADARQPGAAEPAAHAVRLRPQAAAAGGAARRGPHGHARGVGLRSRRGARHAAARHAAAARALGGAARRRARLVGDAAAARGALGHAAAARSALGHAAAADGLWAAAGDAAAADDGLWHAAADGHAAAARHADAAALSARRASLCPSWRASWAGGCAGGGGGASQKAALRVAD
jgi:hypothetical protein